MALEAAAGDADQNAAHGKLEKAYIVHLVQKAGDAFVPEETFPVQFNPSEYSIRRGFRLSESRPLGRDAKPEEQQVVSGEPSVLTLKLYFDSYTELALKPWADASKLTALSGGPKNAMPSFDMNTDIAPKPNAEVNKRLTDILKLIKYNDAAHEPPMIGFLWGNSIFFRGKLVHYDVDYTVFSRDGTPVRARLSMTIMGEDASFGDKSRPFMSPDRTKQRMLRLGDRLWMTAQEEYGNVAQWKTIARANEILNPRTLQGAVQLKVPSIR